MNKLFLLLAVNLFSVGLVAHASLPTSNSHPLPTMKQTNNMDTVMTEKIQEAIVKTPSLHGQAVSAASRAGIVTLQGSVANKNQEKAAIAAARSVKGVTKVNSQLTIKATSPN